MDFSKALKIALDYYVTKGAKDILEAYDTEGQWIIFGGKKGETQIGSMGIAVDKTTGQLREFFLPSRENFRILRQAKKIDL